MCTRLGIFVAPGALGLFLGNMWSRFAYKTWIAFTGTFLLLCFGGMLLWLGRGKGFGSSWGRFGKHKAVPERSMVVICCFLVVVLRSYVGMSAAFPWKNTVLMGAVCAAAVAGGKAAGGFLADRIGIYRAVVGSLALAALMYGFGRFWGAGVLALLFFNMTMPLTLYLMWNAMREQPGLAFGMLTFALFLGFLPVYFPCMPPLDYRVIGSLGSLISLFLLVVVTRRKRKGLDSGKGAADGTVSD